MSAIDLVWFRRDLRLADLPTLLAVADTAAAVFVLDDVLLRPGPRRSFLFDCLRRLDEALAGRLLVTRGDPVAVIPALARELGAGAVHISADFGPYGSRRDRAVAAALGAVPLLPSGSPYVVAPGRIRKSDGTAYRVFTPFRRAWLEHGWRAPARTGPDTVRWLDPAGLGMRVPIPTDDGAVALPAAGEAAAAARWHSFLADGLDRYHRDRDRPDLSGTTGLSPYLKFGCLHPRTVLQDLRGRGDDAAATLRSELCWRDFYADVLHDRPDTAQRNYNPRFDRIRHDTGPDAQRLFEAWAQGRTGFPIVDAGMRQLLAQGWMHNRVRMIVASFLTKDLHLPWRWGARHFMRHLVDGDLASNQHGWQWTAGSGTDAAPYFRVFNPIGQGEKFDPDGDYVRRWVPELRGVAGKRVHRLADGRPPGYPEPIVDHAEERREALARYAETADRGD
ncbi:cryptochrome/photolyase family protein [Mycolicibacterium fallax]|uniref:Deoxyribodipyrimidine photolyase n=1 Tax=Mycolicibacterium fallax TaxID=1793 RepID=A0A1X1RD39_MYCFA|nr:deoxyribodipyrimidine photo-lyase [Mycolicibacterium fallax]ORV03193.1 deoxyribodipyrimidine photolyase [Mycolicibacterium fallax]BBY98802.1 deoxyribodipyrimidine photo-lyase [Mycolicibacterium fallax]